MDHESNSYTIANQQYASQKQTYPFDLDCIDKVKILCFFWLCFSRDQDCMQRMKQQQQQQQRVMIIRELFVENQSFFKAPVVDR